MTNIFYPARRTLFFALLAAVVIAAAVGGFALQTAVHARQRIAVFTISAGERLSALWGELERDGLATPATLDRISREVAFPQYPFVPPPSGASNRFEGLFVPGSYRMKLPVDSGRPRDEQLYTADLTLVTSLLAASARRLESFAGGSGVPGYDAMILASIVQKEDVPGRAYDLVASVFLNRLKEGMHLDSCPTLEYALGYHRPFLLYSDVRKPSPYNTYLNGGLPPTPICFFTSDALNAVVHPHTSPYYFFVLDWVKDRITFAATYSEQKKNAEVARENYVREYGIAKLHEKEVGVFY